MEVKSFVVMNVPDIIDKEDFLIDYLESNLDREVEHLESHPDVPDRFLITLKNDLIDIDSAENILSQNPIEDCLLKVEPTCFEKAIIVEGQNLIEKFSPYFLKLYFQSQFADNEEIVSKCVEIPGCKMVAISFEDDKVLTKVLNHPDHTPLPKMGYKIKVRPFCHNFHGYIPYKCKLLYQEMDGTERRESCLESSVEKNSFLSQNKKIKPENLQKVSESQRNKIMNSVSEKKLSEKVAKPDVLFGSHSHSENPGPALTKSQEPKIQDKKKRSVAKLEKISKKLGMSHEAPRNPFLKSTSDIEPRLRQDESIKCTQNLLDKDKIGQSMQSQNGSENITTPISENQASCSFESDCKNSYYASECVQENQISEKFSRAAVLHYSGDLNQTPVVTNAIEPAVPSRIICPLKKSHWKLLKNSIKGMNLSKCHYDDDDQMLSFESLDGRASKHAIRDLAIDVRESREKLTKNMMKVFKTTHGEKYLNNYLAAEMDKHKDIEVTIEDDVLEIYGIDVDNIDDVKEKVMYELFHYVEIDCEDDWHFEKFKEEKKCLENKYKIHLSWDLTEPLKIQIVGVHDDVEAVKTYIQEQIDESRDTASYFEFSGDLSMFIIQNCTGELNAILKNVKSETDSGQDKYVIKYSGKEKEVDTVSTALKDVYSSIQTETIDVLQDFAKDHAMLILKEMSLLSPGGTFQNIHELFMGKNECLILNVMKDESGFEVSLSDTSEDQSRMTNRKYPKPAKKKAFYQINPSTQLKIKLSGNIIYERSDILVCILHESLNMAKTNISKAFLNVIPELQNTLNATMFSSMSQLIPINSNVFKCKAVIFVILSPWNPLSVDHSLQQIISDVFIKAAQFGAKSISFPPLGLGRVLGYPEDAISMHFFGALKDYVDNHASQYNLQNVKFLACSKGLYYSLKQKGSQLFHKIKNKKDYKNWDVVSKDLDSKKDVNVRNAEIRIIHRQSGILAPLWKTKLKEYVSHEYESETSFDSLPPSFVQEIRTKLQTRPVLFEIFKTKSGGLTFKLKGSEKSITEMRAYIAEKMIKECLPSAQNSPSSTTRRDSLAFLNHAVTQGEDVPSYWKNKSGIEASLVHVNDRTRQFIERLLLQTWIPQLVGMGSDASKIPPNSRIEFISVERVENPALYKMYALFRRRVLQRMAAKQKRCESIRNVMTFELLPDFMKQELSADINEHYLFHGTKQETVDTIIKQGCDPTISSASALFGKAIYAAESSTNADQYTDDIYGRLPSGSVHSMFLMRMLLGDVFVCDDKHPSVRGKDAQRLERPPCKNCHRNKCTCGAENFDSVLVEGKWQFRQFVVYRDYQCYPEYLIRYKRF